MSALKTAAKQIKEKGRHKTLAKASAISITEKQKKQKIIYKEIPEEELFFIALCAQEIRRSEKKIIYWDTLVDCATSILKTLMLFQKEKK